MAHDPNERALDGLRALEQRNGGAASPSDGSPGRELAASVVVPGAATLRRRPVVAVVLLLLGVVLPIALGLWALKRRSDPVGLAVDSRFLGAVAVVGIAVIAARLAAVGEVAYQYRGAPAIAPKTGVATVVTMALAFPVLYVASTANDTRNAVAAVFDDDGDDEPLFVPDPDQQAPVDESVDDAADVSSDEPGTGTDTSPGDSVDPEQPIDPSAITNVLLLGGDAGPGRFGMRTDSMILVSIHQATGRTALVSIPRNLVRLRFPPGSPMAERFPDGFNEYQSLTNAVFTYVTGQPELMEHYGESGLDPRAIALSEGIGYSLDVRLDDYALVNMQGFTQIVDAVGGVTLDLDERVTLPKTIAGERELPETIGPGRVDMDGALAIAFVRSRKDDSDYQRMGRQRQLLAALGSQVTVRDALSGFGEVAGALEDSLRTSLSGSEFADLLDRLGDNSKIGESIGLIPPLITPGHPDWALIQSIIDAEQHYVLTGEPTGFAT
jgi:LCP family protein required for cell wall assembly